MKNTTHRKRGKMNALACPPGRPLLGSIAALLFFAVPSAFAGSAQWVGGFSVTPGDWNTAQNWNPMTIPNAPADVATFSVSSTTGVSISADTQVNGIVFNAGASAYTISAPAPTLTISGTGISNNSGILQRFATTVDGSGNAGTITFANSATAGVNTSFLNYGATVTGGFGGFTQFLNSSSAGSATFINNAGTASGTFQTYDLSTGVYSSNGAGGGATAFYNNSTAANGVFINNGATINMAQAGATLFFDNSSAGNGVFINNGGTVGIATGGVTVFYNNSTAGSGYFINNSGTGSLDAGATEFYGASTAGTATFVNNGGVGSNGVGGGSQFYDNSSAGSGTFINNGGTGAGGANSIFSGGNGGLTLFSVNSTAANAILIANGSTSGGSGGLIAFIQNSTGGAATVKVYGNGSLDISLHNAPGVSIGSIEGSGNVFLGANNLTVGGNNLSTTFSGVMQDGGSGVGVGGSLSKIGTGALTLTGANTFTGSTTVSAGALLVNGSIASAKTSVAAGAALFGNGTIGGDLTNNGFVVPGNISGASMDLMAAVASGAHAISGAPSVPTNNWALNVKGNYTQSNTGALVILYAGSASNAHTSLNVQGHASLSGPLDLIQLNGGRLGIGQQVPIVTAAGGVSGKFSTVEGAALINATVVYEPTEAVLETSQGSVLAALNGVSGISPNLLAVAIGIEAAAGDPRAARLFSVLDADNLNQLIKDIQHISPDTVTATTSVGTSTSNVHLQNLQLRMQSLQAGATGFSALGFHITDNSTGDNSAAYAGPTGPDGKGGKEVVPPPADNRWGSFITGAGDFDRVGDTSIARGFNLDSGGITLGVDYRFTDHFVAGIFAGYTYTGINIADGGRVAVDAGKAGLYATYFEGIPSFPWDFSNAFSAGVCEEPSLYEASEAIGGRSGSAPCPHPHPVSFKVPPNQVSMGFEGNRMPADQDRNPTEIPEEPKDCHDLK
jgi:uncharacterized protein with beta-barrel porin domain